MYFLIDIGTGASARLIGFYFVAVNTKEAIMAGKLEQSHPQATLEAATQLPRGWIRAHSASLRTELEAATQLMRDWIPAFAGMTRLRGNDKASIEHRQRTSDINSKRKVVL